MSDLLPFFYKLGDNFDRAGKVTRQQIILQIQVKSKSHLPNKGTH